MKHLELLGRRLGAPRFFAVSALVCNREQLAVIEGGDERARGEVNLKDLALGAELAKSTENRAAWVKDRPAQQSVKRSDIVPAIRAMLNAKAR